MKALNLISSLLFSFFISLAFTLSGQQSLKVIAKGTGQTTGHIAELSVTNSSDKPMLIKPQIVFIPSSGRYQSYVGRISQGNNIAAGESASIPVIGYCTDVHKPPVALGSEMPPIVDWICVQDPEMNLEVLNGISIIPSSELPPFGLNDIPEITASPGFTFIGLDPNEAITATWPGTNTPIEGTIQLADNEIDFVPFIIDAVIRIEKIAYELVSEGLVTTPFSNDSKREAEALIQQSIWIYMGAITGESYTKDDFSEQIIVQYEDKTQTEIEEASAETVDRLEKGIDDFWSSFELVGMEAKVISADANLPTGLKEGMEKGLGAVDTSQVGAKIGAAAGVATGASGAQAVATGGQAKVGTSIGTGEGKSEVAHSEPDTGVGAAAGQAEGENGSAEAADLSSNEKKNVPDKDVLVKEDFPQNKQQLYEQYKRMRQIGESHKNACKKNNVIPDSELGKALKRVFDGEKKHPN